MHNLYANYVKIFDVCKNISTSGRNIIVVPFYLGVLFFAVFIYLCKFSNKKWTSREDKRERTVHLEGVLHLKQEKKTGTDGERDVAAAGESLCLRM